MLKSSTFARAADICGLLGSLIILAEFAASAVFPDNDFPSALVYGTGALLLLTHATGLLIHRKGRPKLLSTISLAVGMLGLGVIALYAIVDTLGRMGIRSINTDDYWGVLMIALLMVILSISVYAITALVGSVYPAWVAVPHAVVGLALVLSVPVLVMGVPGVSGAVHDFVNTVSILLLSAFFALWGLMSVVGLVDSSVSTPTSSRLLPRRDTPT